MNLLQLTLLEKKTTKKKKKKYLIKYRNFNKHCYKIKPQKKKKKDLSKYSNINRLIDAVNDPKKNNTIIYAMHHIVKPKTDFLNKNVMCF